jgi:3-phytase
MKNGLSLFTLSALLTQKASACVSARHRGTFISELPTEISGYDSTSGRLFIASETHVQVVDINDPAQPRLVASTLITDIGGDVTHCEVKNGIRACGIPSEDNCETGVIAFFDVDGKIINTVPTGYMPDSLKFTSDFKTIVVANEGEPRDDYSCDPEGSVTVIDVSDGARNARATQVSFRAYNGQEDELRAQGVRIFSPNATAAQDFEPEYIAFSPDDRTAYVVLQENNAILAVDVATRSVSGDLADVRPLKMKDWNGPSGKIDASNRDGHQGVGKMQFEHWPIFGMNMPDQAARIVVEGEAYYILPHEGDSREYSGFNEETRVKHLPLDKEAFPNWKQLQEDKNIGRLKVTTTMGDWDGDGKFEEIYAFGSRSFSVWNNDFTEEVYESKDLLETIIATEAPIWHNAGVNQEDVSTGDFDQRSDDKGPEPEGVDTGVIDGTPYAFIGIERSGGGVFAFDMSDPSSPEYCFYVRRDGDASPEGILFIPRDDSPNGVDLLVVSNEISSTVSIYELA